MYGILLGYSLIALAVIGVSLWFKTPAGKRWIDGGFSNDNKNKEVKTMKSIGVKYIRASHKDVNNGQHLVIQTDWMQLVGCVRFFSRNDRGEEGRKAYLASKVDPHFFAKANGYRVYVSLYGALKPVSEEEVQEYKETIHEYLQEMAQFYAEQMTEGMRREYAD